MDQDRCDDALDALASMEQNSAQVLSLLSRMSDELSR
jgi:hypothetical protein